MGGANKLFVLQDMKRGPISLGSFLLAPLPKSAQHGGGASVERAGTGNAPHLILIART